MVVGCTTKSTYSLLDLISYILGKKMTKEQTIALSESIGGLSTRGEKELLWDKAVKHVKNGGLAIEVGTWTGGSAVILAEVCKQKNARLLCIDAFSSDMHSAGQGAVPSALRTVIHNTEGLPVDILAGNSTEVVSYIADSIADLIYIDGEHMLPNVKIDIQDYFDKLKKGGIYIMHDYGNPCDVKKVADHFFGAENLYKVDSMAWLEKQNGDSW